MPRQADLNLNLTIKMWAEYREFCILYQIMRICAQLRLCIICLIDSIIGYVMKLQCSHCEVDMLKLALIPNSVPRI